MTNCSYCICVFVAAAIEWSNLHPCTPILAFLCRWPARNHQKSSKHSPFKRFFFFFQTAFFFFFFFTTVWLLAEGGSSVVLHRLQPRCLQLTAHTQRHFIPWLTHKDGSACEISGAGSSEGYLLLTPDRERWSGVSHPQSFALLG